MISVNSVIKASVCTAVAAALTACASVPADPELNVAFRPVITHQTQDLTMSCPDLQSEIKDDEHVMQVLDKQIAFHNQQSQTMAMFAAFSGFSAATANNALSAQLASGNQVLANAGQGMENNQQLTTEQLRANYNQRHDALIQIYFARKCGVNGT